MVSSEGRQGPDHRVLDTEAVIAFLKYALHTTHVCANIWGAVCASIFIGIIANLFWSILGKYN